MYGNPDAESRRYTINTSYQNAEHAVCAKMTTEVVITQSVTQSLDFTQTKMACLLLLLLQLTIVRNVDHPVTLEGAQKNNISFF